MADYLEENSETWEEVYSRGHTPKYPYESVISFVFGYAPKDRPREEVRILETGFGTGNNLWFAAREGFDVAGVEVSPSAVAFARERFARDGLRGDLRVGSFTELPFEDESFDLVIDRGALTCVGREAQKRAIGEIRRVLRTGGKFHYNPLSDAHSAYRSGRLAADGVSLDVSHGKLAGLGALYFSSRRDLDEMLADGWRILELKHNMQVGMLAPYDETHAFWLVIAEKVAG